MQLNDLKPAWQRAKFLNAMCPIDSGEILSIIGDDLHSRRKIKIQSALLNLTLFMILTISCQGG